MGYRSNIDHSISHFEFEFTNKENSKGYAFMKSTRDEAKYFMRDLKKRGYDKIRVFKTENNNRTEINYYG